MATLRHTLDSLRDRVQKAKGLHAPPKEICFRYYDELADDLLQLVSNKSLEDRTVWNKGCPWPGPPVTFSTTRAHPSAERALLPKATDSEFGNQTRLKCVADLLRPLSIYEGQDTIDASIVLDSEIWASSIERYDPGLRTTIPSKRVKVSIEYRKSTSIPGLQIADLVAGINRQYLLNQTHEQGYRHIQDRTIYQISAKAIRIDSY